MYFIIEMQSPENERTIEKSVLLSIAELLLFFQVKKNMASLKFHSVAIWFSLSLNLLQYTRLIRFTIHFRMILNVLPATSELSLPLNRKTRLNVRNKRHFVYCVWCKRKTVEIPMNNHTQTSVC